MQEDQKKEFSPQVSEKKSDGDSIISFISGISLFLYSGIIFRLVTFWHYLTLRLWLDMIFLVSIPLLVFLVGLVSGFHGVRSARSSFARIGIFFCAFGAVVAIATAVIFFRITF
jgi:hypothetical protein